MLLISLHRIGSKQSAFHSVNGETVSNGMPNGRNGAYNGYESASSSDTVKSSSTVHLGNGLFIIVHLNISNKYVYFWIQFKIFFISIALLISCIFIISIHLSISLSHFFFSLCL